MFEVSDEPNETYEEHMHKGRVSFFVVKGSIEMMIDGTPRKLIAGDRIDVPVGVPHTAKVGIEGCSYVVGEDILGDSE